MTSLLSRQTCSVKFEHRFVSLIPELRLSCLSGQAQTPFGAPGFLPEALPENHVTFAAEPD